MQVDIITTTGTCTVSVFPSADVVAVTRGYFGSSTSRPIFLDNVQCTGSETNITQCTYTEENCDHSEDAGVICGGVYIPITYVHTHV